MSVAIVANVPAEILTAENLPQWSSGLAVLALLLLLATGMGRLRGTTLVAPCVWAMVSALALGVVAFRTIPADAMPSTGIAAMRFAAAVTSLCPLIAVLGAKRPQDRGWQWVVATLWLVLVWPAGQAWLSRTDLNLFIAWKLFLIGLVAIGLLNYLPTRYWLASVLVALGQLVLLGEFLGDVPRRFLPWMQPFAATCFFAAGMSVVWQWRRAPAAQQEYSISLACFQHQWRIFRDAYGTFWGLRILGRVNETAQLRDWPMRLAWRGFTFTGEGRPTAEQLAELEQAMSTILRRFT